MKRLRPYLLVWCDCFLCRGMLNRGLLFSPGMADPMRFLVRNHAWPNRTGERHVTRAVYRPFVPSTGFPQDFHSFPH
jgi:hypothetical protein